MIARHALWLVLLTGCSGTGNTFFTWTDPHTGQETRYVHAESILPGTVAAVLLKQVDDQEPVLLANAFETGPLNAAISGASDIVAAAVIDLDTSQNVSVNQSASRPPHGPRYKRPRGPKR